MTLENIKFDLFLIIMVVYSYNFFYNINIKNAIKSLLNRIII